MWEERQESSNQDVTKVSLAMQQIINARPTRFLVNLAATASYHLTTCFLLACIMYVHQVAN